MRAARALLLAPLCVVACVYGDAPKGQAVSELRDLDTEEAAFVTLINNYRRSMGLGALVPTRLLNQVAYDHSLDMGTRRYFDHTNLQGLSPFDRMARAGYTGGRAENIAAGNADARATFEQWRTSAGHNRNMLDGSFRAMGIGRAYVAGSPYRYYWTNVFGSVIDSSAITGTPTPTPTPGACVSGLAGSGTNGGSGARCLGQYRFNVEAGRTYTISTCERSMGDTFLVVSGACACTNDDLCDVGSECTCTATATGVATLCASTYATQAASWNYTVTSTNGGRCSLAGTSPTDAGAAPDVSAPTDVARPDVSARDVSVSDVGVTDVSAPDASVELDAGGALEDVGEFVDDVKLPPDTGEWYRSVSATATPGCSVSHADGRAHRGALAALGLLLLARRRRRGAIG